MNLLSIEGFFFLYMKMNKTSFLTVWMVLVLWLTTTLTIIPQPLLLLQRLCTITTTTNYHQTPEVADATNLNLATNHLCAARILKLHELNHRETPSQML